MSKYTLHYVTNRGHEGDSQRSPDRYGKKFSDSGSENLRFGKLTVEAEATEVAKILTKKSKAGAGDGVKLTGYFAKCANNGQIKISSYREKLDKKAHEDSQTNALLGSAKMFDQIRKAMLNARDVVILVHGYNVDWETAVGTALSLQVMLNRPGIRQSSPGDTAPGDVMVVLFTWPSDGSMLPFVAYKSDRAEAGPSGAALGRSLLRLRDYLVRLPVADHCKRNLNLVSHSMGNYVLQHAIARAAENVGGRRIPCIFDHIFLCSADVDDDVLEPSEALARLPEMCNQISVYYNRGDAALGIADVTKGHPDRLGSNGAARPGELHHKIQQIDCSDIVTGLIEHSYYLTGRINEDIRLSLDAVDPGAASRDRVPGRHPNSWKMV